MSEVKAAVTNGVAVLTLDAPDRRNAITLSMCEEIAAACDAVESDPAVGAIVVTGAGSAFCAGADLSHLGGDHGRSTEEGLLAIYEGFLRIARSPLPTIAAVNGAAVGAGLNLALACDVRVAGHSARYDARFLQLGIHPGDGCTWLLNRIVGPQAAAAMVLFGEILDGADSERVGLSWRCVPDGELVATAITLAERAAAAPRDLVLRTKATLADTTTITDHAAAVNRELGDQAWSADQPAFRERLAAMQKRISNR